MQSVSKDVESQEIGSSPEPRLSTAEWVGGLRRELLAEGVDVDIVNEILRHASHEYFARGGGVVLAKKDEVSS